MTTPLPDPDSPRSDWGRAAAAGAVLATGILASAAVSVLGIPPLLGVSTFLLLVSAVTWSLADSKRAALRLAHTRAAALGRSEERFRSLAAASPLGVFSAAADGTCQYANDRLCALTGRSADELAGRGLTEAFHPDDRAALRKAVTSANHRSSGLRLRVVLPDGTLRWVKAHAGPLRDDDEQIIGWVGSVEDVTAEVEAQIAHQQRSAELAYEARHDSLTGLPNRAFFTEQITELLAGPDSPGVTVLFIDVDRFKIVNDSLGHDAGDRLLVVLAQRLQQAMRPGDLPARFAGDEFVLGLTGVRDSDQATFEARRLLAALNQTMIIDNHEITVTVSIGVAIGSPGTDATSLMTHADSAMYGAKARGKARIELYQPASEPRRAPTLELEGRLRNAIEGGELRLRYQPIAAVQTGAIVGVESLVRWQHPERGLVGPDEFIPIAEDSGLIIPLGLWVLREACAQLDRWKPLLDPDLPFSITVNVSPRQLADQHFPSAVAAAVRDYRINPASLCIEITESALLQDTAAAEAALLDLRNIGVRIAVDDFGTGYSSLSHLRLLPIDMLKIDSSFVREVGVNADSTAIVGAMIRLAGALGLSCVAEGVEERYQLNWLASMGCEMAQGYYLAMPEPPETVAGLLAAGTVRNDTLGAGVVEPAVVHPHLG